MSEHTPGPWHWHNCGGYHVLCNDSKAEPGECPDGIVMDDGSAGGEYGGRDVRNADSLLIAAAPDLLAACEAVERQFPTMYDDAEWMQQLRVALKKARGETP